MALKLSAAAVMPYRRNKVCTSSLPSTNRAVTGLVSISIFAQVGLAIFCWGGMLWFKPAVTASVCCLKFE
jgi:hypothetical protein